MRYPRATPYAYSVDIEKCTDLDRLVHVCRADAILPKDSEKTLELEVGSIVLTAGAGVFDPAGIEDYGYGMQPNVLTGLEYERILSASGPTLGQLLRPSDGRQPKKVAWIQCVGSRSVKEGCLPYCSSACCMYALKEAMVTKERFHDDIETVIFYMDMRTSGKDYELYLNRAKDQYGVRLERTRPHTVEPVPGSDDLSITYVPADAGLPRKEVFDLVVLSTGLVIPPDAAELARRLGISSTISDLQKPEVSARWRPPDRACMWPAFPKALKTSQRPWCRPAQRHAWPPSASGVEIPAEDEGDLPPERDVSGDEPRIGVFICDCGTNIGGVLDVHRLVDYAARLPQVVVSLMTGHGCSRESLETIQQLIRQNNLNRVVIGGCSPRTHETLFQDTVRKAGLQQIPGRNGQHP